jgi:hypothetical protein
VTVAEHRDIYTEDGVPYCGVCGWATAVGGECGEMPPLSDGVSGRLEFVRDDQASEPMTELGIAVLLLMAEDHADWRDIHAGEIARLLGVEPGEEPFTWRWAERLAQVQR